MKRYFSLEKEFLDHTKRKKVAEKLLALNKDLSTKVPEKKFNQNVIIATWNIRNFDSNNFGEGPRLDESFYYIAEVLSHFDLIAVQEVNQDLKPFYRLMELMGGGWDYIMTDITEGSSGNGERMTFIYDTNRVSFEKIAGEIVLSKKKLISFGTAEKDMSLQFARTPFLVGFRSGWFHFKLCTVHIYFGADYGQKLKRRVKEIEAIASNLSNRAKKYEENLILLGDFNIKSPGHITMDALEKHKFIIPEKLKTIPSNMDQNKHYDQIAFIEKEGEVLLGEGNNSSGVYNLFEQVFSEQQFEDYLPELEAKVNEKIEEKLLKLKSESSSSKIESLQKDIQELQELKSNHVNLTSYYLRKWRTFQMSDHLPMWTELKINFSEKYLSSLIQA